MTTPARISILLACYLRQKPPMNHGSPVQSETITEFAALDVIEPNIDKQFDGPWMTTALGDAWVRALCKVAIPQPAFVDESGNII